MSELVPVPLDLQLRRAFLEYEREGKMFDLPKEKFFRGLAGLDLSVTSNGHRASTPLGPAAGPHDQLLQNIVLCWLGGARIIELKTVQILDELQIPRPCIDAANVTYNVEWSQELKLERSVREYVAASMFLEVVKASRLLGDDFPYGDTVFDMSAGYNLEGVRSPRMRAWLRQMKDASEVIDELRPTLTGRFRQYRDHAFNPCISDTITLSTFHGCPVNEIEGIVRFLLTEMGLNVCVKMNPTLLGREQVAHLLHEVLGYHDIVLADQAFENDLKFEQAAELVPRLDAVARDCGRKLSLKFSNTLVVKNHRGVFKDELMYMSGPPLHVLTLNLVKQWRERMGAAVPLSFSAGLTANNLANVLAMNFVPVTTCTDLLKPGGYGRLHKYLENLGTAMRDAGANTIPEFIVRHAGQGEAVVERVAERLRRRVSELAKGEETTATRAANTWIAYVFIPTMQRWLGNPKQPLRELCTQLAGTVAKAAKLIPGAASEPFVSELAGLEQLLVEEAGLLNTPVLVERATADERYRYQQNKATPRKLGSKLSLFDCIACDKCVSACPNDANFAYEAPIGEIAFQNYELLPNGGFRPVAGGSFRTAKARQIANYADACNECGNCDLFCPEDGGPMLTKPRFFGSLQRFREQGGGNAFFIDHGATRTIHGTIAGKSYELTVDVEADRARFSDEHAEYVIQPSDNLLVSWRAKGEHRPARLDLLPYLQLKMLLDSVCDPRHVNYANVAALQETL